MLCTTNNIKRTLIVRSTQQLLEHVSYPSLLAMATDRPATRGVKRSYGFAIKRKQPDIKDYGLYGSESEDCSDSDVHVVKKAEREGEGSAKKKKKTDSGPSTSDSTPFQGSDELPRHALKWARVAKFIDNPAAPAPERYTLACIAVCADVRQVYGSVPVFK